ncbi:MAG: Holliday junction branch migration protein RuvA [Eubacterium sp.]|nr:Holliday junction branch migration protein RuvA [Eubacterium sp.]
MFEYIKGRFEEEGLDYVVLECQDIGYRISVSANTMAELPRIGEKVKVFIHPAYREDDITLYGFATAEEREIFRTVIGVSGIGPKVAMGLLSQFTRNELIRHILGEDAKAIAKAPGIGLKTANRIILELKDKYKGYAVAEEATGGAVEQLRLADNIFNEAVNGLMGLGYSYIEASALVEQIMAPGMSLEDILKQALVSANPLG